MAKRPRNDTLYLKPEVFTSLINELGKERFETFSGRKASQIYLWKHIGCPIIYGKYLLLKYPHLLTWTDFGITTEEDLEKFQEYSSVLRSEAEAKKAERKNARA